MIAWQAQPAGEDEPPSDDSLLRALAVALAHGGAPGRSVDVIVVDEPTLTDLHARFLGDPTPTDVVTFDLGADEGTQGDALDSDALSGAGPAGGGPDAELYVSLDMAREVARERGVTLARELTLYVVHGALHLCGLDDIEPSDRAAMRTAEAAVMGELGFDPDEAPHDRGPEGR